MTQTNYNNIVISILIIFTLLGILLTVNYYLNINNISSDQGEILKPKVENQNNLSPRKTVTDSSVVNIVGPDKLVANSNINNKLLWGAYLGNGAPSLENFEKQVGNEINFYADFRSWQDEFPADFLNDIGKKNKTLVIFWEPNFGYDTIIDGTYDTYIKDFAKGAKQYADPVILVPFAEMNLNEEAWGYGQNNNNASKFILAWRHIYELFEGVPNVKFGLAYNNISIPDINGNQFSDYYPGDAYVDYIGLDGFSFNYNWQTFEQIFDKPMTLISSYNKPIIIFSVAAAANAKKATWIKEGLGTYLKSYKNLIGFIWFNEDKEEEENWLVDSDLSSLEAFRSILP